MGPSILLKSRVFGDKCANIRLNGVCQVRLPLGAKKVSVPTKLQLGFLGMVRDPYSSPVGLFGVDKGAIVW